MYLFPDYENYMFFVTSVTDYLLETIIRMMFLVQHVYKKVVVQYMVYLVTF